MWRIDEHECRSEVDEEAGELDQHQSRGIRIERKCVGEWNAGDVAGTDFAQRQQLDQPERKRAEQRQLQQIATDSQVVKTPRIQYPAQQNRERADVENGE